ncbi:GtrA family protein [Sphingomonas sp.]|uniref:GtrA family protein n=1 Tax=Sphingomonas sp. TaxID=28214 RepID=UPI0035A93239
MIRYVETLMRANPVIGQLLRFAISGGISTVIYIAVYVPLTTWVWPGPESVYAVPFAFVVAVTAGFFLHSRWSFKGHGTRESGGRQQAKFVVVQGVGLAMNAAFTWGMTAALGLPSWAALIPVVTITPIATFALNRQWVFGGAAAHG